MGWVTAAIAGVSAVTGIIGSKKAGDAQADAIRANAEATAFALDQNADILDANAELQLLQGQANASVANANAAALENTAAATRKVGKINAIIQTQSARTYAERARRLGQKVIQDQRVAYAKAGVQQTSGTPVTKIADTAAEIELEAQLIEYEGRIGAVDALLQSGLQAYSLEQQAAVQRVVASNSLALASAQASVTTMEANQLRERADVTLSTGGTAANSASTIGTINAIQTGVNAGASFLTQTSLGAGQPTGNAGPGVNLNNSGFIVNPHP